MTTKRVLIFLLTIIIVGTFATLVALYARGYRFDPTTFRFAPHGILVIKSHPDGSQVYINGELETATNATIRLAPGTYDVSVRREGYLPWQKRLTIEKEVVTEADAQLFRVVPSLSAVTFSGVVSPLSSPDYTKIAYIVPSTSNNDSDKEGLWVMETVNLPLGFTRDPRRITDGDLTGATWRWSPNAREILLTTRTGVFLLDAGTFTPQNQRVNVASSRDQILEEWQEEENQKLQAQLRPLPNDLKDILSRKTSSVVFSPDETKILYTASSSATIPEDLIKPVPGSSTQEEERSLRPGHTYVYDIKEDRNFLIDEDSSSLNIENWKQTEKSRSMFWFATSRHLVLAEQGKLTIMDYDGTNRQEVYSGSYIAPSAFPTLNTDRLLMLTNLGADSAPPNIYSLNLK